MNLNYPDTIRNFLIQHPEIAESIENNKDTDLHIDRRINLFEQAFLACKECKDKEGYIVEAGVFTGGSSIILSKAASYFKRQMILLDSFVGLPSPSEYDKFSKGSWNGSLSSVEAKLQDEPTWYDMIIIKGFFKDTLPLLNNLKIIFLHLDVDLYKSYLECCKYLLSFVTIGGRVVLDEYYSEKHTGAKRGVDEILNTFTREYKLWRPYANECSGNIYIKS